MLPRRDLLLDDYQERCSTYAHPVAGMAETLTQLRKRGLALGIITNGEEEFQSHHIAALGLEELVDKILISEAEGVGKPDAAIFVRAAQRLSIETAECLFVGDNPTIDVLGAHAAGMRTAWFQSGFSWPSDLGKPCPTINALSQVLDILDNESE